MNLPSIKRAGVPASATISDRKLYLLQLLIDPYFGRQFTVMRRPLSTAIDRGALSLSKECLRADTPRSFAKKAVRSGRRDTPSDSIAHGHAGVLPRAAGRRRRCDSQPGLRRGAGRCSNARWGGHAYGHDHECASAAFQAARDRIAPSVERAGAVAPTTK